MLARIRPAGLVCRLVRQEKHNTRLVNVRYRRGASSSSSSHRPDVVPFGSVVGLLLNDGDCCWTTTRQCFGGDTSQRDTSQRDTSQRRAGRGGGAGRCLLVDTRPGGRPVATPHGFGPALSRGRSRCPGWGVRNDGLRCPGSRGRPMGSSFSAFASELHRTRGSLNEHPPRLLQTNSFYALLSQQEI